MGSERPVLELCGGMVGATDDDDVGFHLKSTQVT